MSPVIVGISGRKASGKSTVARSLAAKLSWSYASFGAYVRQVAEERQLVPSPEALQELGAMLIECECRATCEGCLRQAGWMPGQSAIIEGVRHVRVADELSSLALPGRFVLVFLDVPEDVLLGRLPGKGIMDPDALKRFEAHSTEVEVRTALRAKADLVLNGAQDVEDLTRAIARHLSIV